MTDPSDRAVRVIGITGPIGCGKSTVAAWLAQHPGVMVIDADAVARDVLEPGAPETEAAYARFGEGLRGADGKLDRAGLGRIVFADPDALRALEAIVHPAVRPRILAALETARSAGASVVAIEAIKLVEGGLAAVCDEVWLVTCEPDVQLDRLVARGTTRADARTRIAAQAGLPARVRPHATRVVDTSGGVEVTRALVEAALDETLASVGWAGTAGPEGATRPT